MKRSILMSLLFVASIFSAMPALADTLSTNCCQQLCSAATLAQHLTRSRSGQINRRSVAGRPGETSESNSIATIAANINQECAISSDNIYSKLETCVASGGIQLSRQSESPSNRRVGRPGENSHYLSTSRPISNPDRNQVKQLCQRFAASIEQSRGDGDGDGDGETAQSAAP